MNNEKIIELDNLSKKSLVVKGNPLIQAKFDDMGLIEQKILIAALSKITPNDKVLDFISFEVKDFCNLLKIQKDGMYTHLKNACDKLLKRIITIEFEKNHWQKFSWLRMIEYKHGLIRLRFHPDLETYLLYRKENISYTKYLLENIIDMNSKYSLRIYELLKQYETIGHRTFSINELKELIGIPVNKYTKIDNFRRKILAISKNEINGLTDLEIEIEEIKEGRKISKIKFFIKRKNFNINTTTNYDLLPKLKLISITRKRIHDLTGVILNFNIVDDYHRIILIEMIKRFDSGMFNKVLIKSPLGFFKWHFDDIKTMYDLTNIEDY